MGDRIIPIGQMEKQWLPWLIRVNGWQNPSQYVNYPPIKINYLKRKKKKEAQKGDILCQSPIADYQQKLHSNPSLYDGRTRTPSLLGIQGV